MESTRTSTSSAGRSCCPARFARPALSAALAVLAGVMAGAPAFGGTIHPAVREALSAMEPGEQAAVLVVLDRQADIPALDLQLKRQGATRQERHRRVIESLQEAARAGQPPLLADLDRRLRSGEIAGYTPYWIMNLVAVRGTPQAIEDLAARDDVAAVEPNLRPALTERIARTGARPGEGDRGIGVAQGLRAINAPRVWHELGINGGGALVANLDTGVDGSHPALRDQWRGNNGHPWQECWHDVVGTPSQVPADDVSGHGTHVMGTSVGLDAATHDSIGVAWGAQWIAANPVAQGVGNEFNFDVFDCLQWLSDPDGNPETVDDVPDVALGAWGVNEYFGYDDCDMMWWSGIDACEAAGIVMLWSAGGDGPASATIRSPADRATTPYNCFSIGAVDAANYDFPFPVTSFSSRGPTGCHVADSLKIKPEVVSPGVDIYSCVPGGHYDVWSGTAMASAHVAGVVALMRSASPDLEVDAIKAILMQTARDSGPDGEDNAYGWGTIDAYAAVTAIAPESAPGQDAEGMTRLFSGHPNPFTGATTFRIRLAESGPVRLAVYDAGGRLVRTLLSGSLGAAEHVAVWDGRDDANRRMPPGVYFCRLHTLRGLEQEKTILME